MRPGLGEAIFEIRWHIGLERSWDAKTQTLDTDEEPSTARVTAELGAKRPNRRSTNLQRHPQHHAEQRSIRLPAQSSQ
jgi:hypothetical protein